MTTTTDGGGNNGGGQIALDSTQLTGAQLIERIPCWRCQHRIRLGDDQWVGHGPDRSFEGVRLHQVVGIPEVVSGVVISVGGE